MSITKNKCKLAFLSLGLFYLKKNNLEKSLYNFQEAFNLNEFCIKAWNNTGYIYISRDYGSSVKRAKLPLAVWNSISMSDDGTTIIVSSNSLQFNPNSVNLLDGGYVYISKDTGLTWLKQESQ